MKSPRSVSSFVLLFSAAAFALAGCGGAETAPPGTGGAPGSGGASSGGATPGSGGASSGGAPGSGGATPGSGGRSNTGGSSSGGSTASGGANGGGSAGSAPRTGGRGGTGTAGSGVGTGGAAGGGMAAGGSTMPPGKSAGCGTTPTIASSMYNNGQPIPITAANLQRRYILSVPTNYVNTTAYKLVIAWHARDSNDHTMYNEKYYGLQPLSNNTTIFVAPNGQKNGAPCSGTGAGDSGCGWPNSSDQDMKLADAVIKAVTDSFCVDMNRIFATGWSYGASMSEETACERPIGGTEATWGVRAVATYAVARLSGGGTNCKASKKVAYFGHHGTCDSVLTYDGATRCSATAQEMGGVGIAKTWATLNGCMWTTPQKVTSGNHVCTKFTGCSEGYPVEFCSHSGDHTAYPSDGGQNWGPGVVWPFLNQF